jgi:hypothetical protein
MGQSFLAATPQPDGQISPIARQKETTKITQILYFPANGLGIYQGKPSKRDSCETKIYEMLDAFLFFLGAGSVGALLSWMARNFSSINSFCN